MGDPLVCVLTPVYNGAKYLAACIESVISQTYAQLEYTIVDNCSADGTLKIAESYAARDPRIRVVRHEKFVSTIENHNRAFQLVQDRHKYCKVVSADDWIFPECIRKLVELAEANPTVGVVGSYQRSGSQVKWQGLPATVSVVSGREAARIGLLQGIHILGTPTSVLYRSSAVRMRTPFFPHLRSHADTSACYEVFRAFDFGFVHETLSEERVHPEQWSAEMDALDAGSVAYLDVLARYGPAFLGQEELTSRREEVFAQYYRALGGCLWEFKGGEFWRFQQSGLREIGHRLAWAKVARAAIAEAFVEARHPAIAMRKVSEVLKAVNRRRRRLNLRAGEWVEVRSAEEILATLDENQSLDGLPFMPEMLQYCGKRFRVYKSAHKTCDTIQSFRIRRMKNADAVHLEELRCDGSGHGGCQAVCLLFWKEAWLKRAAGDKPAAQPADSAPANPNGADPLNRLLAAARQPVQEGAPERYRCQATEMLNATTPTRRRDRFDPRFYIRDLTSGNVTISEFIRFGALAVLNSFLLRWFGRSYPRLCGSAGKKTPSVELNLQSGDLVKVRSKEEIMKTLNPGLRNRGMGFDVEMIPYCSNGTHRVLRRVEKILNEKTGEMMRLPNPCLILDGVTCQGRYSHNRMFCPRHIYPYFHEIWLKRTDEPPHSA